MYWTLELASYLSDAPWPANKDEEEEGEVYESIIEIWPDYPTEDDYLWNDDEY